jgi:protein translocase SecG subunit
MQQVIIAIHLMVVLALVALVLYQKSEGGALGLGQSGLFSGRGQANALTRATSILGTIFFVTSILLTVLPAWERHAAGGADWTTAVDNKNIQIKEIKPAPGAASETKDKAVPEENESVFEQLKRAQEKRQAAPQNPAAPQNQAIPPQAPEAEKPALRPSEEPSAAEPKSEPAQPQTTAPKSESEAAPQSAAPVEPKSEPAKPSTESSPPTNWAVPTK